LGRHCLLGLVTTLDSFSTTVTTSWVLHTKALVCFRSGMIVCSRSGMIEYQILPLYLGQWVQEPATYINPPSQCSFLQCTQTLTTLMKISCVFSFHLLLCIVPLKLCSSYVAIRHSHGLSQCLKIQILVMSLSNSTYDCQNSTCNNLVDILL
jgi:hypothetical protein